MLWQYEGMFARRAPSIQINVPAIYPNALPPNITPSSSPFRSHALLFDNRNPCLELCSKEIIEGLL